MVKNCEKLPRLYQKIHTYHIIVYHIIQKLEFVGFQYENKMYQTMGYVPVLSQHNLEYQYSNLAPLGTVDSTIVVASGLEAGVVQ